MLLHLCRARPGRLTALGSVEEARRRVERTGSEPPGEPHLVPHRHQDRASPAPLDGQRRRASLGYFDVAFLDLDLPR